MVFEGVRTPPSLARFCSNNRSTHPPAFIFQMFILEQSGIERSVAAELCLGWPSDKLCCIR